MSQHQNEWVSPNLESFLDRHIGPSRETVREMLQKLEVSSLDALIDEVVPRSIRADRPVGLPGALTEVQVIEKIKSYAQQNKIFRSFIGLGYYPTHVPAVIQRNILENPAWYTQYTPYQAEISQGRLEALLNFQTMISDLTGLPVANASLLDEATAAAEAMTFCYNVRGSEERNRFWVDAQCLPQTIEVIKTRARPMGIKVRVAPIEDFKGKDDRTFGVLIQQPGKDGLVKDYSDIVSNLNAQNIMVTIAADLLSLTMIKPPGEIGADVAVGTSQRFGVPMGFGGPHAGYFATSEKHQRRVPGRIVGLSRDRDGRPATRLALQTREQHIRRDKATSNICTSQVLLAIMASMYAVYHGPDKLKRMARQIRALGLELAHGLAEMGYTIEHRSFFDTVSVLIDSKSPRSVKEIQDRCQEFCFNFGFEQIDPQSHRVRIALDETCQASDIEKIFELFFVEGGKRPVFTGSQATQVDFPTELHRESAFLTHSVFHRHRSESEMLRYIKRLEGKDLSLAHSMIPLGSCTMKLNASTEMVPVTWPEFGNIHPFAPVEQTKGYLKLIKELEDQLSVITGFDGVSLQPNAGSQGEYAGLLVIKRFHEENSEGHRHICLIPQSAHGTNPASAVMAGMKVVVVQCDRDGNVDLDDLRKKAGEHKENLAALMITYPSTHGVFEEGIRDICQIVHDHGGQVYMDGANMNAQIGLCYPGDFGPDVCHLNLHKTFCIPHGGGGPGVGPIGVRKHLQPFLPSHPLVPCGGEKAISAISAAPYGSPSILPISWSYISLMGANGLTYASKIAILNANYIAHRLQPYYPVLYRGSKNWVAHECIVDLRPIKAETGIEVEDVAKRLMDYGFHAPTVSFPVIGTMMIEPTESESKAELDRFCDAMIEIKKEIDRVAKGEWDKSNNPLKNAPHTVADLAREEWDRPYSRQQAVFPLPWVREQKFWPSVARIDNVQGDRNLICACPPIDEYQ